MKDSEDFINKMGQIGDTPENAALVTADTVGIYPSISHKVGLKALKNSSEKREQKHIPTEKLTNMAELVPQNSLF